MAAEQALRVGIIGVGFGAAVHIPGFQSEGLDVVAVAARREARAQETAAQFSIPNATGNWRELVASPEVDVVSIVSPHTLHCEMAVAALEGGKHVLCEKPTAVNAAEARAMREAARASPATAMIAHEFRWAPQRSFVRRLLDDGYIGDFRFVRGSLEVGPRRPPSTLRPAPDPDLGRRGGFLWGLGSHYLDAFRHWFGEIVAVQSMMRAQTPERAGASGAVTTTESDDTFAVLIEFENGRWGSFSGTSAAPFGQGAQIEVFGSEGSLSTPQPLPGFNPPPDGKVYGAKFGGEGRSELPMPADLVPFDDERDHRLLPFRLMVRDFIKGVHEGASPAPNFEDAYRIQQVLDAVVESSETGRRTTIDLD